MSNKWLVPLTNYEHSRIRLFCIPYAGGGASVFRNWKHFLSKEIEAIAIQLPGRETRFSEPPISDFKQLIVQIIANIQPHLSEPFAIYGHSLGAAIAFELTHELERLGFNPDYVFLSGRQSPELASLRTPIAHLPDNEFLNQLMNYNGTPQEIFENKELIEMLLPMLRADFFLAESYQNDHNKKIKADLSALGSYNDPWLTPKSLEGWRNKTAGKFASSWFKGDHLYLNQDTESLVRYIQATLKLLPVSITQ